MYAENLIIIIIKKLELGSEGKEWNRGLRRSNKLGEKFIVIGNYCLMNVWSSTGSRLIKCVVAGYARAMSEVIADCALSSFSLPSSDFYVKLFL